MEFIMASEKYTWNTDKMACVATYTILGGDKFLDQFDEFFLKIQNAGDVKLTSLPYYPKFDASSFDLDGRADQMSRKFFKFIVLIYTNRKENPADSVEDIIKKMRVLFKSKSSTFTDLAETTDKFFKFTGE
jgi:hypothetical protein